MNYTRVSWLALLISLSTIAFICDTNQQSGRVIAVVGDETLTLKQLVRDLPPHIRSGLSSVDIRASVIEWINEEVLYQEARSRQLDKREDVIREFERLKRELLINKLVEQTLGEDVTITEEEIQGYYEANKDSYVLSQDLVHAYHLLVATRQEATEVRNRLRSGESFQQVAQQAGEDSLANIDWDWGYFSQNDVIPEISQVVFKLRKNSVSQPVKSDLGYHIFQLVDRQDKGEVQPLAMVREEIRMKLREKKKQDMYQRFLLQMKSKYKIQTNFQLLDSAVMDSLLSRGKI